MTTDSRQRLIQLFIRWFFILLPTTAIVLVTLKFLNISYTAFATGLLQQTLVFAIGLTIAYSVYFFRTRWIITFILLWLVYYAIHKTIVKLPGEFDVFYATARFELFAGLFLLGWLFGFLLARLKFSFLILVAVLAVATLIAVSNTVDVSLSYILSHLIPVVIYGLYMLFLSPLLTNSVELDLKKSSRLFIRFAAFLLLAVLAFFVIGKLLSGDLKAVEKEIAARGEKDKKNDDKDSQGKDKSYDQRYGLMDKPNPDDGYRLKDTMKINSKMSQSDVLMFCSKLDSYLPNGEPKPLYFVYHYLTRYDPIRETFTRDVNVPFFDEFDADPSAMDMYHAQENDSIIYNSMASKYRSVVEAKVYLSSNTWKHSLLAPSSAFYVQSIPVEKDFQKTYYAAYRVKSFVSELNNAYFVYNPSASPMLDAIQQQRIKELESVGGYAKVDRRFMDYYTQYPKGELYDSISRMARRIAADKILPVDKVIAIRDYFLARDENGKRIFRYTLKPGSVGDPNIPTATMLGTFLFKTHAGYCTYYAGASLFMLRSLGIPSRFTTGFATVNRNDKNKGWYWFYASQAHAWTQVYFPDYGWLDFDMTIGNEEQHDAPKPDGTPPLPPPEPWLVLNSKLESGPDKVKMLQASFRQIIYFDEGFLLDKPVTKAIDASHARVLYDKKDTTLSFIQAGDSLVIVSFKDEVKQIPKPQAGVAIDQQVAAFPKPLIADEIHIKQRPHDKKEDDQQKKAQQPEKKPLTWQEILIRVAWAAGVVVVLALLIPVLLLAWLTLKKNLAKGPAARADAVYQSALFQFHMAGAERDFETPLEYAHKKADPMFGAGFAGFMSVYLKLKYGKEKATTDELQYIDQFTRTYGSAIRARKGIFRTAVAYLNLALTARYFMRPVEPDDINNHP